MCEALQLNWKLESSEQGAKKNRKGSYSLRDTSSSSAKRRPVEKRNNKGGKKKASQPPKKRGPKPRPRPLPMSKYRRKTANMRERQRMGEINSAFDVLKAKIPVLNNASCNSEQQRSEKMTKINVLHVAINYIRALENILHTGDAGVNEYGTAVVQVRRT